MRTGPRLRPVAACPNCGSENAEGANFCSVCGAQLGAADAPEAAEVRKTVTIVFCDVTGSTELGEQLDPESMRKVMARYFDAMRAAIERHGGSVEKFIGDAVMAVFGIPQLHEDDALRAVRAAVDMRAALEDLNHELERDHGVRLACRIGVNTGEVLVGADATDFGRVTGDAVNTAARLEAAADPGEILIGDETYRLVRDAVEAEPVEPLSLKGKAEPVPAHRLIEVVSESGQARRALLSTMVGRDRELEDLTRAFARAAEDRSCLLFTVLGAAGEGKTRLVEEFLASVGGSAQRGERPLPPVRRGHHVLAGGRGRSSGRSAFRRSTRPRTSSPEWIARGRRRRARGRDRSSPRRDPGRRRERRRRRGERRGRSGGSSRSWPPNDRSSRCGRTSTGPSPRSSTSSTTSWTGRATRRSCSCARRGRSSSTPERTGAAAS